MYLEAMHNNGKTAGDLNTDDNCLKAVVLVEMNFIVQAILVNLSMAQPQSFYK